MRRKAFTLVELLVVVAIIAILAGILFPVFAQAREKARTAHCTSNLNQVTKALQMYGQDHDDMMCPAQVAAPIPRLGVWDHLIQEHIRSSEVLMCPSWKIQQPPARPDWALTYGMNYRLTQASPVRLDDAPPLRFVSSPAARIRAPSQTIWLTDNALIDNPGVTPIHFEDPTRWLLRPESWNPAGITRFPQDPPGRYPDYISDPWRPAPVHQGGVNVAFCDGHVKWFKADQLVNPPRGSPNCLYDNAQ